MNHSHYDDEWIPALILLLVASVVSVIMVVVVREASLNEFERPTSTLAPIGGP